ncbi:Cytochrome P450 [Colletotrichum karsti]|uniref:Cytochrome P450 n=1 Tax=Colletotrichum karsti TaxID=1095194 RepID=A0A9P6HZT8_9PEZI|nr:Cytochrome P450 [Colletotrichum karsti]KAF9874377.1 Cytochrome P450 [Colletotrichum karsti]
MGFIEDGCDKNDYISNVHGAFYWIANLGNLPWKSCWMANTTAITRPLGLQIAKEAAAFSRLATEKVIPRIQQARSNRGKVSNGNRDMLDHFIDMRGPSGEPATVTEIIAEVGNLLAAGADTTSVAVKAVLAPILKHPARYHRLQNEIDCARATAASEKGENHVLTFNDIKDLAFLGACIKEGTRLHPSLVYQLPRKAPAEGFDIDGYFIDSTATVGTSAVAYNRCQAIFGEDADKWRPERWIEGEGNTIDRIKEMDKNLATFGFASRTCIGRNLATLELFKFIAQLLIRYDVELVDPDKALDVRSLWFAEIYNMQIKLKLRS